MADWQFRLDFKDFWRDEDEPVFKKAEKVVERIKNLLPAIHERAKGLEPFKAYRDYAKLLERMASELEREILPMFEEVAETESEDEEDFDYALEYLYDWADTPLDDEFGGKKMCWVSTVI